jgi:hypothetical protein
MARSKDKRDKTKGRDPDSSPRFSPNISLDPRYSPRTSSLPRSLPREAPKTPQPKIPWQLRAGIAAVSLLVVAVLMQSTVGKRALKRVVRVIEAGLKQ